MTLNECIPYYDDGEDITGHATAAVVGKRFLKISADRQAGGPAGVTDDISGGNVKVAQCVAGDKAFGVSSYDVASGGKVPVIRGQKVVPVTAGAAITAGQEVQSDAAGKAIPLAAGKSNGLAVADAANNADAQISLYV